MSIPDILLAVCVLILVWRVWRLETRAKDIENNAEWLLGCIRDRAHKAHMEKTTLDLCDVKYRTNNLASALGYEWKRTDAKEGWEKRAPIEGRKIDWVWMDEPPRFVHAPSYWADGKERRKADRRKPAPEIKVKQFCDSCDEKAVKRAKAQLEREINRPKKRRAH